MGTTFTIKRKRYGIVSSLVSPSSMASIGTDSLKSNLIDKPLELAIEDSDYTPTVKNKYLGTKSYGVVQAVSQVGKGLGKGLLEYGKKNKSTLTGIAGFSGAAAAGGYGLNRIQRQQEEINSGEREADGMSTGGKTIAAGTALGTGALAAYKSGASHDKLVNKTADKLKSNINLQKESTSKGLNSISSKATQDIKIGKDKLKNLTRTSKLGMSNKSLKMTRNGLLAGAAVAGAGLLANSMLKQKNNSLAAVGKLAKKALGGKTLTKSIKDNDWSNVGKAAGVAVSQGSKSLAKSASNFLSPGSASGMVNTIKKNLAESGEYGKKAADFLGKNKTASMVAGAGLVGTGAFNLASSVGEKPVEIISKLDKKTSDYVKSQNPELDK